MTTSLLLTGAGPGGFSAAIAGLPLDGVANVQVAYSTRLLRTAYAGASIQLQRTSDSATQDIGFSAGWADSSAVTTFCGIGNINGCFVNVWYDQSGNGKNQVDNAISTITFNASGINSHPTLAFTASGMRSGATVAQAAQWTVLAVTKTTAAIGFQLILNGDQFGVGGTRVAQYLRFNTTNLETVVFNTDPSAFTATQSATPTNALVVSAVRDGTSATNWINGTASSPVSTTGTPNSGTDLINVGVSADDTSNPFIGNMGEVILIGAASTGLRSSLETNMRTAWGI